jgi:hypothetical protein
VVERSREGRDSGVVDTLRVSCPLNRSDPMLSAPKTHGAGDPGQIEATYDLVTVTQTFTIQVGRRHMDVASTVSQMLIIPSTTTRQHQSIYLPSKKTRKPSTYKVIDQYTYPTLPPLHNTSPPSFNTAHNTVLK